MYCLRIGYFSDWWAHLNDAGKPLDRTLLSKMVLANHDLYMVVNNTKTAETDLKQALEQGVIKRAHLVEIAFNILRFIYNIKPTTLDIPKWITKINQQAFNQGVIETKINEDSVITQNNQTPKMIYQDHKALILGEIPIHIIPKLDKVKSIADLPPLNTISINPNTAIKTTLDENIEGHMGEMKHYRLSIEEAGKYIIGFHLENTSSLLSQTSFNLYFDQYYEQTFTYNQFSGTLWANAYKILKKGEYVFSIKFNQSGLKVHTLTIQRHP